MGWWWIAGCLAGFVWKAEVQRTVLGKADWCVCVCVYVCCNMGLLPSFVGK